MDEPMVPWPNLDRSDRPTSVGVVVVNWNTRELLGRLLFGLKRVVEPGTITEIVVVDNASDDGSTELARSLADAGAVRLIANDHQRYHGPGLTQGVNLLAELARDGDPVDLVWTLDTDILILRSDVLTAAVDALETTGTVFVGERADYRPGPTELTTARLSLCSVLFDPVIWQHPQPPFREDGEPSRHLQAALLAAGHRLAAFPFCTECYLLHLGRGTLNEVLRRADDSNQYLTWARTHSDPHYGLVANGAELAARFEQTYRQAVGDGSTDLLVDVLTRP
jgi:glycosyltransferase involved in cell wall biosynthesis